MKKRISVVIFSILLSFILAASPAASVFGPQATITAEAKKKAKKSKKKTKKAKKVKSKKAKGITLVAGATKKISVKGGKNFKSSNKKVVSVTKKGVLTANKPGTATITGKCSSGNYSVKVTVPDMNINETMAQVFLGESLQLNAGNAANVKWSSSNDQVASVNNGLVTAVGVGSAVITASAGKTSVSCTVSVPQFTISQTSATINYGQTLTLTVSGASNVTWSSSNEAVATVSGGVVKSVDDGSAVITATAAGYSVSCNLTIVDPVVIRQPAISYKTVTREATRNGKPVYEEINQTTITFNGLPQRAKHMKKIDRSNGKGSEADGKQDGKYLTVACALAAMTAYSEGRDAEGQAMMNELLVSPHISRASVGGAGNLTYYFGYDNKKEKLPWAFFEGSKPYNYNHNQPITVVMEESPYAPQKSTIYGVELSIEQILFHTDNHPCLKNNLTVQVYRDPSDGQWYLWPSGFNSLLSTASIY
ncbi:Ig-like domain-containing protein [Butyrivibrio sp. AD3002]|uniref:Ig-like domain-containing protein n=1 Tax=Butyrivibrio sp. AD3002 TaxID=1280670 RepID=UPI0003B61769|nr:Ig-like domain-containing protein [Butyrivibrio sp. AD3002]